MSYTNPVNDISFGGGGGGGGGISGAQFRSLKNKVDSLEASVISLQDSIGFIVDIADQLAAVIETVNGFSARLDTAESKIITAEAKIATAESDISAAEVAITSINTTVFTHGNYIDSIVDKNEAQDSTIATIDSLLDSTISNLSSVLSSVNSLTPRVDGHDSRLDVQTNQINSLAYDNGLFQQQFREGPLRLIADLLNDPEDSEALVSFFPAIRACFPRRGRPAVTTEGISDEEARELFATGLSKTLPFLALCTRFIYKPTGELFYLNIDNNFQSHPTQAGADLAAPPVWNPDEFDIRQMISLDNIDLQGANYNAILRWRPL